MTREKPGRKNIIYWLAEAFLLFVGSLYMLLINDCDIGFIFNQSFDFITIFSLIIFYIYRNGFSALYILLLLISFDIHSYGAEQLGNFSLFYQISWLGNALLLILNPAFTEASVIYHLGLGFEPSMMRNTGLGMQMSYYCSNQVILLLAVVLKRLVSPINRVAVDIRHLIAFFIGLTLLNHHSFSFAPGYTSQYMMLFFSLILFWSTSSPKNRKVYMVALMAGGLMAVLNSYLNSLLVTESLSEFFMRRASAPGIHANRLATWLLAMLWFLLYLKKAGVFNKASSLIVSFILGFLLVLTGARLILMIALLTFTLYFLFEKGRKISLKAVAVLLIVAGLFFLRVSQQISINELIQNERFSIWYSAWQNFLEKPVAGNGIMSFAFLPQFIYEENRYWILDWNYPHSHQMILELLLWGGLVLFTAFLIVTAINLYRNKTKLYRFTIVSLLMTGLGDFAWNTPSMTAIISFLLFFPLSQKTKLFRVRMPFKVVVAFLLASSIYGAVNLQHSIYLFESSSEKYQKGIQGWRKSSARAAELIKHEPYIAMHDIVKKLAAGHSLEVLAEKSQKLTWSFEKYYASHFLYGRILELQKKNLEAYFAYKKSLELEPLDLSGIRTARLIISSLKANKNIDLQQKLINCLTRDNWGIYICLNHPLFGERLKAKTERAGTEFVKNKEAPLIDRFLVALNLAKTGLLKNDKLLAGLKIEDFPEWLKDKRDALLLLIQNESKPVSEEQLKFLLSENPGPQLCKSVMKLALKVKKPEIALEAYKIHRRGFKYRNKNHEDLEAQYLAAQAFISSKKYKKALFEINRIRAYAPGNPFVLAMKAETLFNLKRFKEALGYFKFARKLIVNARALPHAHEKPEGMNWAEGTHLTKLIEKTARFKDQEALTYCRKKWLKFKKEMFIKEKLL
ncbi:MAG: O-antigen ligase family protein, partial [Candidatus Rifleibacteriota bacterium]